VVLFYELLGTLMEIYFFVAKSMQWRHSLLRMIRILSLSNHVECISVFKLLSHQIQII